MSSFYKVMTRKLEPYALIDPEYKMSTTSFTDKCSQIKYPTIQVSKTIQWDPLQLPSTWIFQSELPTPKSEHDNLEQNFANNGWKCRNFDGHGHLQPLITKIWCFVLVRSRIGAVCFAPNRIVATTILCSTLNGFSGGTIIPKI